MGNRIRKASMGKKPRTFVDLRLIVALANSMTQAKHQFRPASPYLRTVHEGCLDGLVKRRLMLTQASGNRAGAFG